MNGSDWPSPAANLAYVEQQIKKIVADTGVDVPSLSVGAHFIFCHQLIFPLLTYLKDSKQERDVDLSAKLI